MKIVNIVDGSFAHIAASNLGGDRTGEKPRKIVWDKTLQSPGPLLLTDMLIDRVEQYKQNYRCIGWLIEPPSLSDTHYKSAVAFMQHYEKILTFDTSLIAMYPDKFIYYPFGGSWIMEKDWKIYEKSKSVSMIASQKVGAEGHRLRHAIARFTSYAPSMEVDVMGYGYRPIASKLEGLANYRYSIIVESCKFDDYFSEKLTDCLACGTIPIYWGSDNIRKYFNISGILRFSKLSELEHILIRVVNEADYRMRLPIISENIMKAKQYQIAEDWIIENYPELFDDCKTV